MTTIFHRWRILFSFLILVLLLCGNQALFAESAKWTLAAEQFSVAGDAFGNTSYDSMAKSLPSLILEQLAEGMTRHPRAEEQLDRILYNLQKERLSLFLQLSKENQTRNAVLLNNYSPSKLKSKLKEADKKIAAIQKKIDENLASAAQNEATFLPRIQKDRERDEALLNGSVVDEKKSRAGFASLFDGFAPKKESEAQEEAIYLYQGSVSALFTASEAAKQGGYGSYLFEKSCTDSNINGLITGVITVYGAYMSVALSVYQYPGAKLLCSAFDAGTTDDLRTMASSLARQITPRISDAMPVDLIFSVSPESVANSYTVTVDDLVLRSPTEPVTVQGGIHSLLFTAEGYEPLSVSYSFTKSRSFTVEVNLKEQKEGLMHLSLKKPYTGDLFANGEFAASLSEMQSGTDVKINGNAVLAHFTAENGNTADFYIPEKYVSDEAYLSLGGKPIDKNSYIEKRRKWMYAGYSTLIVSLIPTFYCYGNSYGSAAAYNNNDGVTYEDAKMWQDAANITMGISAACGAFFVYELVRYLVAANTVLPKEAKPVRGKKKAALVAREAMEQENRQKIAEEASQNSEDSENLLQESVMR